MGIQITSSGMHTTVQDQGRNGYQRYGFSVSGAMDSFSYRLANFLAGNTDQEAVLEMAGTGASFIFTESNTLAVTGAECCPKLDGRALKMNQPVWVEAGVELTTGVIKNGTFSYIAFAGGLHIPEVMGSQSTSTRYGVGGLYGRTLRIDDEIAFKAPLKSGQVKGLERGLSLNAPEKKEVTTIRFIMGSEPDLFSKTATETFLDTAYTVSSQSDRMGYRLKGSRIGTDQQQDSLSEGTVLGDIQIPPDGQPIVLMADRQTTGGYPVIGTITTVDIPKMVQCTPGEKVRFLPISLEEAHDLLKQQEEWFKSFEENRLSLKNGNASFKEKQSSELTVFEEWDNEKIKDIISVVDKSTLTLFTYKDDRIRIRIDKQQQVTDVMSEDAPVPETEEPSVPEQSTFTIYSNLVGLFFSRPHPDAPPFVVEGESVRADQTVARVEILNIQYDILAGTNGIIQSFFVENDQAIQYGQPLIELTVQEEA
ncbi:MAG: 5-oxoprolinase/urea amidolyase family protein [Alkalibacterium sp.]|nr:5-oxoprolinase/urea amidolyase family protein [Alkalibacterium sp.]